MMFQSKSKNAGSYIYNPKRAGSAPLIDNVPSRINYLAKIYLIFLFFGEPSVLLAQEVSILDDTVSLYQALQDKPRMKNTGNYSLRVKFDSYISDIVCHHTNKIVATALYNGDIAVHDLSSGSLYSQFRAHTHHPKIAWISFNGYVVATTQGLDVPRFWHINTGEELFSSYQTRNSYPVLFKNRYLILVGSEVSILDLKTGHMQFKHLNYGGVFVSGVVDENNNLLYALSFNEITVYKIDDSAKHLKLTKSKDIKLGKFGLHYFRLHSNSDYSKLYTVSRSGDLLEIDTNTHHIQEHDAGGMHSINTFDVLDGSLFLIAGKKSNPEIKDATAKLSKTPDKIYLGSFSNGIESQFALRTTHGAYSCFKDRNEAMVGTITNIVNTPVDERYP